MSMDVSNVSEIVSLKEEMKFVSNWALLFHREPPQPFTVHSPVGWLGDICLPGVGEIRQDVGCVGCAKTFEFFLMLVQLKKCKLSYTKGTSRFLSRPPEILI